mgnify:CR=1 FL=1
MKNIDNWSETKLVKELKKLFDKSRATQQRAKDAVESFDKTSAKADEAIAKSRELLGKTDTPSNE